LDTLLAAAERGAAMVKQVLLFARGGESGRTPLPLRPLLRELQRILQHTLPKGIEVQVDVVEGLWAAPVDATQFTQVIMNLCVNARDAMPNGGQLSVMATNLTVDEHYARMHPEARPGRFVAITVVDSGSGIPAPILSRIFDPFFTTKAPGKGTGLGLSTALGIVKGHGGFIKIYSEVGLGSRFVICFPAAREEGPARSEDVSTAPTGRGELVLVVDDEAAIAAIARQTLEAHGYQVVTAANGVEAVEQFTKYGGNVRVVLTDMMMPVMDGLTTIRALHELAPRLEFIATSGLAESSRLTKVPGARVTVLPKPYTAIALLKTLHAILR
jgi:CheY-like chemotaxis protein